MEKYLLLTLDYELYGDGSGDVFETMIEPTNQLLDVARHYDVKFTIFFEVVEYWRLKEEWAKGNKMGYKKNPVAAIEDQLRAAYQEGHDIQLHIHPQWVRAKYDENHWMVNIEDWRLGGYEGEGRNSLVNLLRRGKETIEHIVGDLDPEYRCVALRAGGYNVQPSHDIVSAMKEVGLCCDSSIYPGGKETGLFSRYDYTGISEKEGFWIVGDSLEDKGNSGIVELPIVAFPVVRWKKYLSRERMRALLKNVSSAKKTFVAKTENVDGGGRKNRIGFFFQKEWQTWDYCLFSAKLHREFLRKIKAQKNRSFAVLVGHPKSYSGGNGFEFLLKQVKPIYAFSTISKVLNENGMC